MNNSLVAICVGLCFGASLAFAGNNQMKDFKYRSCEAQKCIVVEAPVAWLSQANGAFVATGDEKTEAKFQLVDGGKIVREFRGDEIVSQPEISSMTIDSRRSTVFVDVEKTTIEVYSKGKQR